MPKPAFIVDGQMEKKILQRLCPDTPIRVLNCNGEDVALDAIADRVVTLINIFNNKFHPIIILIDRENRPATTTRIIKDLSNKIQDRGCSDSVIIGVPDRMTENWILADWNNYCDKVGIPPTPRPINFEGTNGKGKIKDYLPEKIKYHETVEGVEWFVSANPRTIAKNSRSFYTLLHSIKSLSCRWIRQ
jgi:hypothetical protein